MWIQIRTPIWFVILLLHCDFVHIHYLIAVEEDLVGSSAYFAAGVRPALDLPEGFKRLIIL